MSRTSGKFKNDLEHLHQSIVDILTTPIGSRIMRRDYGSMLFELIDSPQNKGGILKQYAATADALLRWEPRLHLEQVAIETDKDGKSVVTLFGAHRTNSPGNDFDTQSPLMLQVAL